MIKLAVTAALLVISSASLAKVNLTDQMQADLATYESCIYSMVEKYISTDASATEIAIVADRNCAVYHNYFLERAVSMVNQITPVMENKLQELDFEEAKADLLKEFRVVVKYHREIYRDRLIANIVEARSEL